MTTERNVQQNRARRSFSFLATITTVALVFVIGLSLFSYVSVTDSYPENRLEADRNLSPGLRGLLCASYPQAPESFSPFPVDRP